jgi:hypothetical protein
MGLQYALIKENYLAERRDQTEKQPS